MVRITSRLRKLNPLPRYRIDKKRIAVIGGGSWGTALVSIILKNKKTINWYIRNEKNIAYMKKHRHNPQYLNYLLLDTDRIQFYSDIKKIIEESDILFFAVPSAFLSKLLKGKNISFAGKFVVSAIKGIIPEQNITISEYFNKQFDVSYYNIAVISGPCHAEEIALEKLSYLTIASRRKGKINKIAKLIECSFVRTIISRDIHGVEYAAILKNIIAIAAGIYHGLGYGDNFQAVLISNAIREIKRFLDAVKAKKRQIDSSSYLGDLLVTSYSQFSRNRLFGTMIGKGYTTQSALLDMNMIAEGYYSCRCIHAMNAKFKVDTPIIDAVYNVLYNSEPAAKVMEQLTKKLH